MPIIHWLNQNNGVLTLFFSGLVAVATVFYVILTRQLVRETIAMRRLQTEPQLELTLQSVPTAMSILRLHLRNVGMGPAMDIQITATPLTGGDAAAKILEGFSLVAFMKRGLSYLGSRQEVYSGYTNAFEIGAAMWECSFEIKIAFRGPDKARREERWIIDFAEQKGNYQIGTPPLEKIEKHLEKMSKDLCSALSGRTRAGFDIYTAEDREQEELERIRSHKAAERERRRETHGD